MRTNLDNLKGQKVLIIGLGRSGTAACRVMLDLGATIYVQDSSKEEKFDPSFIKYLRDKGAAFYFDSIPDDMGQFDMIVLSPGVSPELPFIEDARNKGVEITGELEIAYRVSKGNFVAITGTNGKTTTTSLTGEIFKASGRKTSIVGNIGTAAISDAAKAEEGDWLVTEASSFQLETIKYFKPVVSAILNLTPDHLNRHHSMQAYGEAKAKIFANQREDNYLVINYDDKACYALADGCRARIVPFSRKEELPFGAFLRNGEIIIKTEKEEISICKTSDLKIIGDHNIENVLAASLISYYSGIEPEIIGSAILKFGGVEHRMEFLGEVDGVKYYNDSKGTNVDATITAIKAVKENIILIAGGDGKSQNFDELIEAFKGRVKAMVLLGKDGPTIAEVAEKHGFTNFVFCKDMSECVSKAHDMAEKGDTVLLSPACASWDMYDDFEQRGTHFKECVNRLNR